MVQMVKMALTVRNGNDGQDGIYYYPHEDGFGIWLVVLLKLKQTRLGTEGTVTAIWEDGALGL